MGSAATLHDEDLPDEYDDCDEEDEPDPVGTLAARLSAIRHSVQCARPCADRPRQCGRYGARGSVPSPAAFGGSAHEWCIRY